MPPESPLVPRPHYSQWFSLSGRFFQLLWVSWALSECSWHLLCPRSSHLFRFSSFVKFSSSIVFWAFLNGRCSKKCDTRHPSPIIFDIAAAWCTWGAVPSDGCPESSQVGDASCPFHIGLFLCDEGSFRTQSYFGGSYIKVILLLQSWWEDLMLTANFDIWISEFSIWSDLVTLYKLGDLKSDSSSAGFLLRMNAIYSPLI